MEHMKLCLLVILLVLSAPTLNLVQGLRKLSQAEEMELERQLKLINKPAIKSFQTEYGEILDCVEIHKQLAFDHPLLKNHSIQMKSNIPRPGMASSRRKASLELPKNIRCPKGTVLIKRVQKEDLLMAKFSPSFWMNYEPPSGHQVATLVMPTPNRSKVVHGNVNVWGPYAGPNQFTCGSISVASEDGTQIANGIGTGWMVNPSLYPNNSRLYAFWSIDSGRSTGCYNMLCPGFVQVSKEVTLGQILQPLSSYGGPQYEIEMSIHQENNTGNWWIQYEKKDVGYYPKQIFTTLGDGATYVGWGGEVYSPDTEPTPAMGSGHFPDEGIGHAAYIRQLYALDKYYAPIYIHEEQLQEHMSQPQCYKSKYGGFSSQNDTGYYMLYGGPPRC